MTTKEAFARRYSHIKKDIVLMLDEALERAIGNEVLDLDNFRDDYRDVCPLVAAVLQRELQDLLDGSPYSGERRKVKRKVTTYRKDYRIWMDYAGDYKSKEA